MLQIYILLLTTLIVFLIQCLWKRRRLYKLASKIPGTDGLPLIGHLYKFRNIDKRDFLKATLGLIVENSTVSKFWIGPHLQLLTDDPDTVYAVLNSPDCLDKPKLSYDGLNIPNGLLALSGELYPKHRKILKKAFMPTMLKNIHPVINHMAKRLVMKIKRFLDVEINVLHFVGACALETFYKAQLDLETELYENEGTTVVEHALELGLERVTKLWLHFIPKFIYKMTKLCRELQAVKDYANEYRARVTKKYQKTIKHDREKVKNKVVDLLLDPANNFSEIEIQDEFINFVLGSHDTTAKTTSILLLMLAIHQDVQQKLIAEIDKICDENKNFTIDVDFLKRFEYMELVLKEAMRLFPAAPTIARSVGREMKIGGYVLPKDSSISISIFKMHRNPKYWGSDAHLFKPERFLDESLNPRAFVPFSGGKRLCIGYRYANIFIKTLLINFFRNYRVETMLKYEDLKVLIGVTINIQQGCMITVRRRENI